MSGISDTASAAPLLGYCTNVHAGRTLEETVSNVMRHATAVRERVAPHGFLPIGLWLSAASAHSLHSTPDAARRLRDTLLERGLAVYTLNGFPYGDFHAATVKHAVYTPHWADVRRGLYTMQLADLLVDLLPEPGTVPGIGREASISTLPLGWRLTFSLEGCGAAVGMAAAQLEQVTRHLMRIEERTGICLHVDLEPEPGCMLDRASHVVDFFAQALRPDRTSADILRHVRVCHDVCHSAVMFEPQAEAIAAYRTAGIRIGKVQVSSAVACDGSERAFRALRHFDEPRWLHQTSVLDGRGEAHFYDDLERAFDHAPDGVWRVHFHVPVFAEFLGPLQTTQGEIAMALGAMGADLAATPLEVETYAWNALPTEHRLATLADGIAEEIAWTSALIRRLKPADT